MSACCNWDDAERPIRRAIGMPQAPLAAGNRFTIAGIGVTVRGNGKSAGVVRSAELVATGHPGTLADPAGRSRRRVA